MLLAPKRHRWIPGMKHKLEKMDALLYSAKQLGLSSSCAVITRRMRDLAHDINVLG